MPRQRLIDKSGNCALCGIWRKVLCRDRIIPKREGGTYEPSNVQWICANCHQDKSALEQSAAHKGRKKSPEQIARMVVKATGRPVSQETRERIRQAVKISWTRPEVRKRMLDGKEKRRASDPWFSPWKGKNLPQVTREKISASLKALPPRPKQEPWIELGVSRTTYYRSIATETPETRAHRRMLKRESYHRCKDSHAVQTI